MLRIKTAMVNEPYNLINVLPTAYTKSSQWRKDIDSIYSIKGNPLKDSIISTINLCKDYLPELEMDIELKYTITELDEYNGVIVSVATSHRE